MALRILLADDSMTAQNMGKKILTDAGFDVVTVSNGAAAVKKLAEFTPDIAILDVYMPGYTGLEVCERLKSAPATARVPVLLSVGKMEPFRPEDGMKARADGVIIKPFEATDLVTVVDKLAERTYGPEAKSSGAAPAVAPAPAAELPHAAENPLAAAQADALDVLEEAASTRPGTAEGLQTFAPVEDGGAVAPEPGIEFTSVPKTGAIDEDPLEGLLPTSLQPDPSTPDPMTNEPLVPEQTPAITDEQESADAVLLQEEALAEPWESPGRPQVESASELPGDSVAPNLALAAAASSDGSAEAGWTAVETEVSGHDLDIDLEAEMQAMQQQAMHEGSVAAPPQATPVEAEAPFLAPLGKTSFDELDAVMEQVASAAPAKREAVDDKPVADVLEDVPEAVLEEAVLEEAVLEEAAPEAVAVLPDDEPRDLIACDEAILPSEAQPAETLPAPILEDFAPAIVDPSEVLDIAGEDIADEAPAAAAPLPSAAEEQSAADPLAYYGLLDADAEDVHCKPDAVNDAANHAANEEMSASLSDIETGEQPATAAAASAIAEASAIEEPIAAAATMADSTDAPQGDLHEAEAQAADHLNILPAADSVNVSHDVLVDPVLADPMLEDAVALPVQEKDAVAPVLEQPAQVVVAEPAADDVMINRVVERVVDRVVDRLKPILAVMVEEILHEIKK